MGQIASLSSTIVVAGCSGQLITPSSPNELPVKFGISVPLSNGQHETVNGWARIAAAAMEYKKLKKAGEKVQTITGGRRQKSLEPLIEKYSGKADHCGWWVRHTLITTFGVDPEDVHYVDSENGCTYGDFQATIKLLEDQGRSNDNLTLITTQFHLPRAFCKFVDVLNGRDSETNSVMRGQDQFILDHFPKMADVVNGDAAITREMLKFFRESDLINDRVKAESAEQILLRCGEKEWSKFAMDSLLDERILKIRSEELKGLQDLILARYSSKRRSRNNISSN